MRPAVALLGTREAATAWLRDEWRAGRTSEIEKRTRLRCPVPDIPLEVRGPDTVAEFYRNHAKSWIDQHREEILAALVTGATA